MPVCQGCGGSYEDEFKFCPYCGRSKPETPKLEINVKVSEEAGKLTCPSCHRADKAQKVSAIIASQTKVTNEGVQSTSNLVRLLSNLPAAPVKPKGKIGRIFFGGFFLIATFGLVIISISMAFSNDLGTAGLTLVFCAILGLCGMSLYKSGIVTKEAREIYEIEFKKSQTAKNKYEDLVYCSGCDCVYLPEKAAFAPIQNMGNYLYSE